MGLMDIPELFLKLWGLWPINTLETPLKRKIYLVYRVTVIGWYSAFNFSYFIGSLRIIIDQEPFERISKCLSVFVSIGLLLWKGVIYLRNDIAQICIQVRDAETPLRSSSDQKVKVAYRRTEVSNKYLNIYIIGSTFSTLVAYAGVSCIEVYNTGPDYWKMDNVSFMHEIYLPIDKLKWRWWIMVANIATACESVVVNIAVQSSFCTLVMYGSLRLEVLRIGMQRFHHSPCGGGNMKSFVMEHLDTIR
ncbi:uncharacterized protein LOC125502497 [Dendroctonus ponderosae]|uniref:uncharacterized protein LOC125502497 n=1 Tax=Dendroctonus ponderosae TaxID=77166 RepID=UPI002034B9E6|nr:uncharacterized protein LOC125502497 [Dendroctonus ponderosae]KAH1021425.1 hypothetical protein HUJ04_010942 [Dendroctonus ponderosae]